MNEDNQAYSREILLETSNPPITVLPYRLNRARLALSVCSAFLAFREIDSDPYFQLSECLAQNSMHIHRVSCYVLC